MSSVRQSTGTKGIGGKGIGGQFKAHEASEPGVTLTGASTPAVNNAPYYQGQARTPAESKAAQQRIRARGQAEAAESLMKAYPDVVAARFVDIGSRDIVGHNGARWPNPDYVDQSDKPYDMRRNFELRDVFLADGSIADKDNQPRFTDDPSVEKWADTFDEQAQMAFDAVQDPYDMNPHVEGLYTDHVNNQHTWFHQLVKDATPRPLDVNRWGHYVDTDRGERVHDVTADEVASLGEKTPASALRAYSDELIAEHGMDRAREIARRGGFTIPEPEEPPAETVTRSWNPFRRR